MTFLPDKITSSSILKTLTQWIFWRISIKECWRRKSIDWWLISNIKTFIRRIRSISRIYCMLCSEASSLKRSLSRVKPEWIIILILFQSSITILNIYSKKKKYIMIKIFILNKIIIIKYYIIQMKNTSLMCVIVLLTICSCKFHNKNKFQEKE